MKVENIVSELKSLTSQKYLNDMIRVGINTDTALGVSIYEIRSYAKKIKKDHILAQQLWDTRIHEARHLACLIDIPDVVTNEQMEKWVKDFNSWDLCDQCCCNLFDKTKYAYTKAKEWSHRQEEFVKRAGFVLMCALAVHDKKAKDDQFEQFYSIIIEQSIDDRKYVKKSVSWALRQIGKRNKSLNMKSIEITKEIEKIDTKSARWIAKDALRELTSERIQKRFQMKK
jgi:3-methyladenine DNA glycosylase AlkD